MSCPQLRSELSRIKSLKRDFDLEFEKASKTRKTETSEDLKEQLEQQAKALREKLEQEDEIKLKRAKEILGKENVHGKEDVEFLLGFKLNPKDIPPIPYARADFEKSKEIKEKTGIQEMLVLFVKDKDGTSLTGEKLKSLIQKKYDEMDLGEFLSNPSWYTDEDFYTSLGLKSEWKLITKQRIPNSRNKPHHYESGDYYTHEDTQEYAIEQYAEKIGIPRNKFHRPAPFQMLYADAIHLVSTERDNGKYKGERVLYNAYHWSDITASNKCFVQLGHKGFVMSGLRSDNSSSLTGVFLSRDPAWEEK